MQEGFGVGGLLLPTDQQSAEPVHPRMTALDHPLCTDIVMARILRGALRELWAATPYGLAASTFT